MNQPIHKSGSRNIAIALVLAFLGIYSACLWPRRALHLPPGTATHASVVIFPNVYLSRADSDPEGLANLAVQTIDSLSIQELVSALQEGRACSDHKCGPIGTIQLSYPSGVLSLDILPGHADRFYEVRLQDGIYRLPRATFVSGLVACGVPREVIPIQNQ